MRRVVEPGRILYIDRLQGWSILLFSCSVLLLAITPFVDLALIASFVLLACAFALLFRKRAFVINHEDRSLLVIRRSLFGKAVTTCPLSHVLVVLEESVSTPNSRMPLWEHTENQIKLAIKGEGAIVFLDDVVGREGRVLAHQLSQDLGCRLSLLSTSGGGNAPTSGGPFGG